MSNAFQSRVNLFQPAQCFYLRATVAWKTTGTASMAITSNGADQLDNHICV